ncbi:MAG: hypothetical protein M3R55_17485 [Acidobacteriota bacterium]|nr:hypothetical protein [Acidobacteriota bacterium]
MLRRGLQLVILTALAAVATSTAAAAADPGHDCMMLCELSHYLCERDGGIYDHEFDCDSAWDAEDSVCDLDTTCTYIND